MKQQEISWSVGKTDAPPPPVADLQRMGKSPNFYLEQYHELGPIFRVPLPNTPFTVLGGPEANAFVSRFGSECLSTQEIWRDMDKEIGVEAAREGEANRQRRSIMSRGYSRGTILERIPRLVEITHEYTQSWQPGQCIPALSSMQRVIAEQLGQLLVHFSPGDYLPYFVKYINTQIAVTLTRTRPVDELSSPEYLEAKQQVTRMGELILEAHRNGSSDHHKPDLMDDMLAVAAKAPDQMTEEKLIVAGNGPLNAGLDTVASTSVFMFYALLKNPQVLERVTKEVDEVFAQGELSWEKLRKMQAVHGAAMETLRLYPVAGSQPNIASQPFTFAGYQVERGEMVIVNNAVAHFLPDLFPEPFTFDIDRYHEPRNEHRQRGAYVPFGLGDHTCLGSGIAEIQLMVICATILHTFELALDPPDYEIHLIEDPLPSPGRDFVLKVVARRH